MPVITVPSTDNVCEVISQFAGNDIVLATSEDDFKDWSACELGAKIAEAPAMVGDAYDYLVLNPITDCIERYPKPAPPVYGSELLNPWFGNLYYSTGSMPAGPGRISQLALALPTFDYDVNLLVTYTYGHEDGGTEFTPGGPIQTPGVTYGTSYESYETLPVWKHNSGQSERSYIRKVFVKAGQVGLELAIYLNGGGGGGWGHAGETGFGIINAIAFKA